jgi:hypothetical protein
MKIISTFFICVLSLTFMFCKGQQKNHETNTSKKETVNNGPQPTNDPAVYKGVTNDSCAVEMAFGSPGSGIDGKAFNKTMEVIKSRNLGHTSKSIGREGETRICLPLTELKGKEKDLVVNELKEIARGGQLVSISIR